MTNIMETSRTAAGSLLAGASTPDMCTVQADLVAMQEQVNEFLEQSSMFYDDLTENGPPEGSEEGERMLKTLMSANHKEKQLKLLQDTNSRLEKLQQHRPIQSERSKNA